MIGCFIFFFALAIFFFCIGWGFLAVTIISILVITLAKLYVENRKGKAHLDDVLTKHNEEKLKSQDYSDKVLVMPEKKPESLSADIKRLKYMDEDQLNDLLPRFAAMYGISLAFLRMTSTRMIASIRMMTSTHMILLTHMAITDYNTYSI